MIKWVVKKFILARINAALDGKDLSTKAATLNKWLTRIKTIVGLLEKAV